MNKRHASQCSLPLIWYKFEVKYYFNWSNQLQLDPLVTVLPYNMALQLDFHVPPISYY